MQTTTTPQGAPEHIGRHRPNSPFPCDCEEAATYHYLPRHATLEGLRHAIAGMTR